MADSPAWLPPQELFEGAWQELLDRAYARFIDDVVKSGLSFNDLPVVVRKHPPADGKEYGFWHCISAGSIEADRIPDPERCRRIGWIRAVIENCTDPLVESWVENRGRQTDHVLWFREEYVVVLSERGKADSGGPGCYLLKSAFCTLLPNQKRKKRKARDAARKTNAAPNGTASNTPSTHGG